jgi:hypothetical protein
MAELRSARKLLEAEQWFAALRHFERTRARCPALESEPGEALARGKLHSEQNSEELFELAHAAVLKGNLAQARAFQDQAAYRLEEANGRRISSYLPDANSLRATVAWHPDSSWVFARSVDGISLRQRGEWYPRFFSASFGGRNALTPNGLVSPDAKTLLCWEPSAGSWPRLSVVNVAPSLDFGNVIARFDISHEQPPFWLPDGKRFVAVGKLSGEKAFSLNVMSGSTGRVEQRIPPPVPGGQAGQLKVDAKGEHLLVKWQPGGVSLVDLTSGKARHLSSAGGGFATNASSPDERFLVWVGAAVGEAVVYDTHARRARTVSLGTCVANEVAVFDDGSRFVAFNSREPHVCVVELASGRLRKLHTGGERGYAYPIAFFKQGAQLLTKYAMDGFFITTDTDRVVARSPQFGELISMNNQPTLVSTRGALTKVDRETKLLTVSPQVSGEGSLRAAIPFGNEVALSYDLTGWVIADAETGKVRSLAGPPDDRIKSPDDAFLASQNSRVDVVSTKSGQRAAGSPLTFASAVELVPPSDGMALGIRTRASLSNWSARSWSADGHASKEDRVPGAWNHCSGLDMLDPSGRFAWDEVGDVDAAHEPGWIPKDVSAQLDCATGRRSRVLRLPGVAHALVQKDRLVVVDEERGLTLWDVAKGRRLASLPSVRYVRGVIAASPDDRWLLLGTRLVDLKQSELVSELPQVPDSAQFLGNNALLTAQHGRVVIRRAPAFQVQGTLLFAYDLSAAIVFAEQPRDVDPTLEVLGPEDAWDSSFTCGVGNQGVPFRVCRQAFTQRGLLASLLR